MAIEYNKTNWVNNVTKLNAENMNHIEDGIEAATNAINESGIYQHKIGFTLDGTNSWYITLVLTTSSAQAITKATLYKYLTNDDYPLVGGIPVDCYRASVQNPAGFGNGRMSATYNAETQTPTYYFALSNENTQETVSTSTASISGFVDTVTEV